MTQQIIFKVGLWMRCLRVALPPNLVSVFEDVRMAAEIRTNRVIELTTPPDGRTMLYRTTNAWKWGFQLQLPEDEHSIIVRFALHNITFDVQGDRFTAKVQDDHLLPWPLPHIQEEENACNEDYCRELAFDEVRRRLTSADAAGVSRRWVLTGVPAWVSAMITPTEWTELMGSKIWKPRAA